MIAFVYLALILEPPREISRASVSGSLGCLLLHLGGARGDDLFLLLERAEQARDASRIVCIRLGADRARPLIAKMPICESSAEENIVASWTAVCVCLILYVNRDTALLHPAACMHFPLWGSLPYSFAHLHFFLRCLLVCARGSCGCIGALGLRFMTLRDAHG
jgi:hypothetical protein